jgi:hypothetical protein
MDDNNSKALDILGIKPIADSINIVTKETLAGASSFLGRICLPAAEEFGLLLRDKVSNWRLNNQIRMLQKSEVKYNKFSQESAYAHPRLVSGILDYSAWTDSENLQDMWAGLLASSCTPAGKDESNLIFINILSQLTSLQAKIVKYCCETTKKAISKGGWIHAENYYLELTKLEEIFQIEDLHRLDREMDHLRSLGIVEAGFMPDSKLAILTPTSLGLQMYVRCQGYAGSPLEFFGIKDEHES